MGTKTTQVNREPSAKEPSPNINHRVIGPNFTDNRTEFNSQASLQRLAASSSVNSQPAQLQSRIGDSTRQQALQLKINTSVYAQQKNAVVLGANGFVSDFKDGDDPGKYGFNGVEQFKGKYKIGDDDWVESDVLSNDYLRAHAGHALAKQNGGTSGQNNIFAQDGGVNTTGAWPSFEMGMRKALNNSEEDDDVEFIMFLAGKKITQGKLDTDHTEEEAFSKSQQKFFSGY